jgi:hypothetical protein
MASWMFWDFIGFFPFYFLATDVIGLEKSKWVPLLGFQMTKLLRFFHFFRFLDVHFARVQVEASNAAREVGQILIATIILLVICGNVLIFVGCPDWDESAECTFDTCGGEENCTEKVHY